jgi:pentatricopeptide repeat protein
MPSSAYWNELRLLLSQGYKNPDTDLYQVHARPLSSTYVRIMGFLSQRKDIEKVVELFSDLRRRSLPPVEAWEHVIWTFLQTGDKENALTWYTTMLEKDYMPSKLLANTMGQYYSPSSL